MAASADWYATITVGIAGGVMPAHTGYRAPDALDLWASILDGSAGPVEHDPLHAWPPTLLIKHYIIMKLCI